jgi:hypothetical protein
MLKFGTIDWLTNYLVGGWFSTLLAGYWYCWLAKTSLLASEFEHLVRMKVVGNFSAFQQKKPELIWTFRTRDMSWKPNSVWAAEQILTSPLLLPIELENDTFKSWTPHESFRSMS